MEPMDAWNEALIKHVHPSDWNNPTPDGPYNLVVIGAGTAGLVSAVAAAGLGAKVALIERHLMGGDCLNVGCVPSKALLRSARAIADARGAAVFGAVGSEGTRAEFPVVMERMRRLRAGIAPHDSARRYRDLGVDVYLGSARFTGPRSVEIAGAGSAGVELRFSKACIATGARASAPPIPGLEGVRYLTNETIFSLTELPARMAIIGAGPIGCEMAQSFARFGTTVTLIELGERVLGKDDPEAGQIVGAQLVRDGVDVRLEAGGLEVSAEGEAIRATFQQGGEAHEVVVDELLVAVGRAPNVDGLGLDEAGVSYDPQRGVSVNDKLRTSNKRIFAAGDVCSAFQFTHTADHQARIVLRNALFSWLPGKAKNSKLVIPWCTYTHPEVAHVGATSAMLEADGVAFDTFRIGLDTMDRAKLDGETEGFLKVRVRSGKDEILGATYVAPHAGETIGELSLAMQQGIGLGALASVIHPYPTQAEIVARAADAYKRTRLTPRAKKILSWLMARQR
jgi:pyruvate/2-oxoglutarate dehydrogenase complex dihydrolipoamide dehydrogenase (E3) component